jgi:uncharacterized protein (DUF1501 family)
MIMNRRNFLKSAAAAGLSIGLPFGLGMQKAKAAAYDGPCFLFVHAQGGWDPRFLFDPTLQPTQNRLYTTIEKRSGIPYAPIPVDVARVGLQAGLGIETQLRSAEAFLATHSERLLVINGLDSATNNHESGERSMSTGLMADGHPALAGLIAAEYGGAMPMAFLSGGGFDMTLGLAPVSRIAELDKLARFGRSNEVTPGQAGSERYHSDETLERIAKAQRARSENVLEAQRLPRLRASMEALRAARETSGELGSLLLQDSLVTLPAGLSDLQQMERQAQLVLTAFAAGLSVCAKISLGGFDTHSDHDRMQPLQLWKLLGGLDFIVQNAEQQGLTDRLVIVVTSDFARGPEYNAVGPAGGKDHWPVTSALLMGPGIRGGRVLGATDDGQFARRINPITLDRDGDGVVLTPGHIHHELRRLAGIEASAAIANYPLPDKRLPLFD